MAILLSVSGLAHGFGPRPLFEEVAFTLADGDRVGLIGPNGAGKSTLLKILAGVMAPDRGTVARRGGLVVGFLEQSPEFAPGATVREAVRAGLPQRASADDPDWEAEARVDELIAKLDLAGDAAGADAPVAQLSGGWQKRVALARALVAEPQVLLLDEPTNHLDVDSILWLERFLADARFALVVVTHDRLFLQRVSNRILELDRRNAGGMLDVAGDYATYLERKAEAMAAQERREDVLRNTLRRETEWLRRGPPARSTKQQARIQRAGELADEVDELGTRNRVRNVAVEFQGSGRQPRRLIEARGVGQRYDARQVLANIDLFIGPGTRLGLLGPNGCGKSTLLRLLIGRESPTTGTVLRADSLAVASFEQDRGSLDPNATVADTVCDEGDFVDFRGARQHRFGYLERFLFRPEQMTLPVGRLSGGEQARLLIARLMLRPAQVMVLDEPTNDLDFATLAVLEDALTSFDGAVLLVSHDRYFLDQVATEILAFAPSSEENQPAQITSFAGLAQWEVWHKSRAPAAKESQKRGGAPNAALSAKRKGGRKMGFKDQRDWDTIEARIAEAEARMRTLEEACNDPAVASNAAALVKTLADIEAVRAEVDALYSRWAELETLVTGSGAS